MKRLRITLSPSTHFNTTVSIADFEKSSKGHILLTISRRRWRQSHSRLLHARPTLATRAVSFCLQSWSSYTTYVLQVNEQFRKRDCIKSKRDKIGIPRCTKCYIMCMSPSSLGNCTIYSTWCIMICLVIPILSLLLFIQSPYFLSKLQIFLSLVLFFAAFSNNYT